MATPDDGTIHREDLQRVADAAGYATCDAPGAWLIPSWAVADFEKVFREPWRVRLRRRFDWLVVDAQHETFALGSWRSPDLVTLLVAAAHALAPGRRARWRRRARARLRRSRAAAAQGFAAVAR